VRHAVNTVLFTPPAAGQIASLAAVAGDGMETGGILLGADYAAPTSAAI
jgi:hypothetical protein